MAEQKVATEVAEAEFERFVASMDLDVDTSQMDAEDRKSLEEAKRRFLRAVVAGSLVVNENGEPVFTPVGSSEKDPITFYEPDGACLMAMDMAKESHGVEKTNLLLAAATKQSPVRFAKMKNRDLKVCQAILGFHIGG